MALQHDKQIQHRYSSLLSYTAWKRVAPKASLPHANGVPVVPVAPPPPDQRQIELENDLQLARDLQQGLMLEAVPRIVGWEISAVSLPARELGGDLYDFVTLKAHAKGIMIGDVSGKGLPAALRMAVARTVFRAEARRGLAPGATLAAVNNILIEEMPQGMVTMLYATIDTQSGAVQIANAGHNYLILLNDDVSEVETTGVPLGVMEIDNYNEAVVTLNYGDSIVLYSDGIIEAMNDQQVLYGYPRLQTLLRSVRTMKPRALMAKILSEVRSWSHGHLKHDDVTMVLVRRRLEFLIDEMFSIVADVVGPLTAQDWWKTLHLQSAVVYSPDQCLDILKPLNDIVVSQLGRGIAREILAQLRPVIEEYRLLPTTHQTHEDSL